MIDQNYITEFEENEKEYKEFYNEKVKSVKLFYIYINENNDIYNIKSETEEIEDCTLTKERILYLIKNNLYNLSIKHKLVSLLKYNLDLEHTELKNFLKDQSKDYLTSLKLLDNIYFKDTICALQDLNSVFFIFTNITSTHHNTTKRINIRPHTSKTRHNRVSHINQLK